MANRPGVLRHAQGRGRTAPQRDVRLFPATGLAPSRRILIGSGTLAVRLRIDVANGKPPRRPSACPGTRTYRPAARRALVPSDGAGAVETHIDRKRYAAPLARPEGLEPSTPGLEGRCSTPVELRAQRTGAPPTAWRRLVGAERFELPTTCSQSRCATRLRHAPLPNRFAAMGPRRARAATGSRRDRIAPPQCLAAYAPHGPAVNAGHGAKTRAARSGPPALRPRHPRSLAALLPVAVSTRVAAPIMADMSLKFAGTMRVLPSLARLPKRSR